MAIRSSLLSAPGKGGCGQNKEFKTFQNVSRVFKFLINTSQLTEDIRHFLSKSMLAKNSKAEEIKSKHTLLSLSVILSDT